MNIVVRLGNGTDPLADGKLDRKWQPEYNVWNVGNIMARKQTLSDGELWKKDGYQKMIVEGQVTPT